MPKNITVLLLLYTFSLPFDPHGLNESPRPGDLLATSAAPLVLPAPPPTDPAKQAPGVGGRRGTLRPRPLLWSGGGRPPSPGTRAAPCSRPAGLRSALWAPAFSSRPSVPVSRDRRSHPASPAFSLAFPFLQIPNPNFTVNPKVFFASC